MKRKPIKLIVSMVLLFVVSCNEPETVVTNYVHPDGSVTRKIEMKSIEGDAKKRFKISDIQVPFDSTWNVKDTFALDKKGDTTWIRRGEKLFKSIEELNSAYRSDSGANKHVLRKAGFSKRFKWFNTEYRFSENIDKIMSSGYPVGDFLNKEEINYFYSPESLIAEKENGPDSLKYKALSDTVKHKTDLWTVKNIVSEWIKIFSGLTAGKADKDLSYESLKAHENDFVKVIQENDQKFDSLWAKGLILNKLIGEGNAVKYKTEADSALGTVTKTIPGGFQRLFCKDSNAGETHRHKRFY